MSGVEVLFKADPFWLDLSVYEAERAYATCAQLVTQNINFASQVLESGHTERTAFDEHRITVLDGRSIGRETSIQHWITESDGSTRAFTAFIAPPYDDRLRLETLAEVATILKTMVALLQQAKADPHDALHAGPARGAYELYSVLQPLAPGQALNSPTPWSRASIVGVKSPESINMSTGDLQRIAGELPPAVKINITMPSPPHLEFQPVNHLDYIGEVDTISLLRTLSSKPKAA